VFACDKSDVMQVDKDQLYMVLAMISSYQQQSMVSLADLNLDAVTPPKLQGIDIPPAQAFALFAE
jgi:hypothetical protein